MNIEDLQYKLGYLEGMISVMEKDIVELKTLVRSLAAKTQPIGPGFTPGTLPKPQFMDSPLPNWHGPYIVTSKDST